MRNNLSIQNIKSQVVLYYIYIPINFGANKKGIGNTHINDYIEKLTF